MAREQSYSNHRRYHPWHHFVVVPILIVNFVVESIRLTDNQSRYQVWLVILALGLLIFSFTARGMSLKAQDRAIRIEERMRLSRLLPGDQAAIDSLRPGQIVALRFAPDDEIPDLMRRISSGELSKGEEIKKSIRVWRPDYLRV
jgi:hypothetical protein